jgi:hypothetical protein
MNANDLKKLATQVRRTDTVLRQLAHQLDLNIQDRSAILKTADLLSSKAKQVSRNAKSAKSAEETREKAYALAVEEAMQLVKAWSAESTLDKVAMCLGNLMESNLRRDLESEPRDPLRSLNYWVEIALSELPRSAAWKAVQTKQPVASVIEQATQRLHEIRAQTKTSEFARHWDRAIQESMLPK